MVLSPALSETLVAIMYVSKGFLLPEPVDGTPVKSMLYEKDLPFTDTLKSLPFMVVFWTSALKRRASCAFVTAVSE